MQIHTTTVVQGTGGMRGRGVLVAGIPPRIFDTLQFCETSLSSSVESLWSSLQDEVYLMGVGTAGGPVTSPTMVAILAVILDFNKY